MDDDIVELECTATELYYLSALLGGTRLLDIDDSFRHKLQPDATDMVAQVQSALTSRGYMEIQQTGAVGIDAVVAAMVSVITFPSLTFLLTIAEDGAASRRHIFHLQESLAVEVFRLPSLDYRLVALEGAAGIAERVCALWGLQGQVTPAGHRSVLSIQAFQTARLLASMGGIAEAQIALQGVGLVADTAHALAGALAASRVIGTMMVLLPGEVRLALGDCSILHGADGVWLLRPFLEGGKLWIELAPRNANDLAREIRQVITDVAITNAHTTQMG